ncbi:MAG: hypothetical protein Q4A37_02875 [Candidatus Saccharibacteria bacterium]|nr:hypothetical protein [Candidatus Saccharibacteria bacterium]
MIDMAAAERELTAFLMAAKEAELRTWERQRSSAELGRFLSRRLALLDEVE